jgi:general secretion pathway protein G
LIELLIVIVVLGILAAIVVFSLTGVSGQSKQAACTADAKSVEIAADAYQAAKSAYPTDISTDLVGAYLHAPPGTSNGYTIGLGTNDVTVTNNTTSVTSPFVDTTGCTTAQVGS